MGILTSVLACPHWGHAWYLLFASCIFQLRNNISGADACEVVSVSNLFCVNLKIPCDHTGPVRAKVRGHEPQETILLLLSPRNQPGNSLPLQPAELCPPSASSGDHAQDYTTGVHSVPTGAGSRDLKVSLPLALHSQCPRPGSSRVNSAPMSIGRVSLLQTEFLLSSAIRRMREENERCLRAEEDKPSLLTSGHRKPSPASAAAQRLPQVPSQSTNPSVHIHCRWISWPAQSVLEIAYEPEAMWREFFLHNTALCCKHRWD